MEWEVWLADGTRCTSQETTWEALQAAHAEVLAMRYWGGAFGDGITWDDGLYGRPDTLLSAGWTDDATFVTVLREAQAATVPPSKR